MMSLDALTSSPWHYSAVALAAFVVGWWILARPRISRDRLPPAPENMGTLAFIKQLLGSEGPQFALKVARETGYIARTPGLYNPCWMLVNEPNLARQILEDPKSQKFLPAYQLFDKATGGETFFAVNGPRAMHVRKSTAISFASQNAKFMQTVVDEVVENWIATRLEPLYVQAQKPVDFDEEMMLVTTEVIARAAMDYPLSATERAEFAQKMRQIMQVFFHQGLNLFRKFFGIAFADIRQARRTASELTETYGMKFIQACRKNPNPNQKSVVYLMLQDEAFENDEQRARDIMLFFFGGFETTAHAIAWTMLELARNQQEQTKLRTALNKEKGDVKQCPQLRLVAKEVLRLHTPAALGAARVAIEDIAVPNTNWIIPKGSACSIFLYVLLRNHEVFGDDADEFVPSRWDSPTDAMLKANLPFGAGKRGCLGQSLANLELNTVVARLCQTYKFEVVDEGEAYYMIALSPKGSRIMVSKLEG